MTIKNLAKFKGKKNRIALISGSGELPNLIIRELTLNGIEPIVFSPIGLIIGIFLNILSRKNEFEADDYAKKTYDGNALQLALKKLSVDTLSNLYPHPLYVFVHYSHPPLIKRLSNLKS